MTDTARYSPIETRHRIGGLDLCAFESGTGPLAILAHGITANARVWDPVAAELVAAGFRVVALDQRGHGRSDGPTEGGYDAAAFAGDLAGLVAALGAGPAVLIGHSLGGRNVLATAALYPGTVRAVVSVEYLPAAGALDYRVVAERLKLAAMPLPNAEAVASNLAERYPLLPPDALLRRRDFGYARREEGWTPLADSDGLETTLQHLASDSGWTLDGVACPALVIAGTLPGSLGEGAIAATKTARPDIPVIRVDGTDHFVHEERPAEVAALILRWLESVPGAG